MKNLKENWKIYLTLTFILGFLILMIVGQVNGWTLFEGHEGWGQGIPMVW